MARRLALLLFTLVLVPSLSFVMFTLIGGEVTSPLDVLRELGDYLAAVFLQGDLGAGDFRSAGRSSARAAALDIVIARLPASTSTCSPARSCWAS